MAKTETPMWRCVVPSYLNHTLYEENAEAPYQPPEGGQVAENLEPLNDAAQAWIDAQKDPHPSKAKVEEPEGGEEAEKPARKPRAKPAADKDGGEDDSVA